MYEDNNNNNNMNFGNENENNTSSDTGERQENENRTSGADNSYHGSNASEWRSVSEWSNSSYGAESGGGNTGNNGYNSTWSESSATNQNRNGQNSQNNHEDKHGSNKESGSEKKGRRFIGRAAMAVVLGLFFGLFAGIGFYGVQMVTSLNISGDSQEDQAIVTESESGHVVEAQQTEPNIVYANTVISSDVTQIVEQVMPSMVSIVNYYTETGSIFGQTYSQEAAASGSGIIVAQSDTELLIVTNYHVIEDADTLEVTFIDENVIPGAVKGTDSDKDLAVVAVQLEDISEDTMNAIAIATLGDSNNLSLGENVIAIGNALGYGQSVTTGVISALNREVSVNDDGTTSTFIQTDAAINPGNSGGALLNMNGEVIGINSAKIGGSTVEGMGFAIPISDVEDIIADLMTKTTKIKADDVGYLGIYMENVSSTVAQMYHVVEGIYVSSVVEGGPAQQAGIQDYDIITEFDGERVTTTDELKSLISYYSAGTTVKVTFYRYVEGSGYQEMSVDVTLGSQPEE